MSAGEEKTGVSERERRGRRRGRTHVYDLHAVEIRLLHERAQHREDEEHYSVCDCWVPVTLHAHSREDVRVAALRRVGID